MFNFRVATTILGLICLQIGFGYADLSDNGTNTMLKDTGDHRRSLQVVEMFNSGMEIQTVTANKDNIFNQRESRCDDFDGDICNCVINGCSVDMGARRKCIPNPKVCNPQRDYWPTEECRRGYSFNSIGGVVCFNQEQDGDCGLDLNSKSNYAVNLNGLAHMDKNHVNYAEHNSTMLISNVPIYFRNASHLGPPCVEKISH